MEKEKKKTKDKGPGLLILGTAKAGTSTLFRILDSLPEFNGSEKKELRFFSMTCFHRKGPGWYHSRFNQNTPGLKFEATPHYLYFPAVPKRVYAYQQKMKTDLKFIVLLRNPAERCYSAWNMHRSFYEKNPMDIINTHYRYYNRDIRKSLSQLLTAGEFPSFEQSVKEDLQRLKGGSKLLEPSYVRKGLYSEQIARWLKWFDRGKFLFFETRDLADADNACRQIGTFLNIRLSPVPDHLKNKAMNKGSYSPLTAETENTIKKLKEFYYPYNEKLFSILGKRYDWND